MNLLQTERLDLRMFRESDFDAYAAICADAEVARYLGDGKPLSPIDAWRSLATILGHWQLRGYGLWAVEERATGAFVGRIGCYFPCGWPSFEVGWALRRASWGKGYATEGARVAMRYAFDELGQTQVISLIQPGNERSIRVAERLGELLEGRTEVNGQEALVYGISREQWQQERQQPQQ